MAESCDLACTLSKNLPIEVLIFSHIGLFKDLRKSWGCLDLNSQHPIFLPHIKLLGLSIAAGAFMSDPANVLFSLNRARIDLSDNMIS